MKTTLIIAIIGFSFYFIEARIHPTPPPTQEELATKARVDAIDARIDELTTERDELDPPPEQERPEPF